MLDQRRFEDTFGNVVPYIRIKDYILKRDEILRFSLESSGFLPTVTIHISSPTNSLGRENMPVDGDRVSIGIRQDKTTFKPIASDFVITSIDNSPNKGAFSKNGKNYYEFLITAKLFIPNIDNGVEHFTYTGLAEEALKDVAIRLGLGYVHTKNTTTTRKEAWHCFNDPCEYIQEITRHMWLGKDSFFDSWIDPRRNLTVINVNDILGRELKDDGELDFTKYKNVSGTISEDGKYVSNDLTSIKEAKFPKLFSNDPQFENSMWYPINYQYINNSTNVSKNIGPQRNVEVYVQNNGVGQSIKEARHTINIGVWYNQEKLDLGYVIANGPTNYTKDFKQADNGNWRDQNTKKFPPMLVPIESDQDADTKNNEQSNLRVSGNFSKEYVIAPEHNRINLAELDKQLVILTTYGANLGLMRGEKVPCFLYNRSNEKWVSETRNTQDTGFEFDMVCSGWFYVKAIELIYEPNFKANNFLTDWKTKVTLTRREWFPPESTSTKHEAEEFGILPVDVASGNSVDSVVSDPATSSNESDNSATEANTEEQPVNNGDIDALIMPELSTEEYSSEVEQRLSGMVKEIEDNLEAAKVTQSANAILRSADDLKAAISSQDEMIAKLKGNLNNIISTCESSGLDINSLEGDVASQVNELSDKIKKLEESNNALKNKLSGLESDVIPKAMESVNNGIALGEDIVSSAKAVISEITSGNESLLSSMDSVSSSFSKVFSDPSISNIKDVASVITDVKANVTSKIESVSSSLEGAKATANNIISKVKDVNEGETTQEESIKEEEKKGKEEDFDTMMAYDGNGLKHFMNDFVNVMNSEGIPYKLLGCRRWAVDKNDKKVYGNAFVMRETSEIYKTLDSDGELYWLSDYNSRHYYGEAVDIEPTSSFDDLLEKICLSDRVLDCMHKYGICIQLEVSKSGYSKGTHFHCSTDRSSSQSKWWGIVNKRRAADNLETYAVILKRDYYEDEVKNNIEVV